MDTTEGSDPYTGDTAHAEKGGETTFKTIGADMLVCPTTGEKAKPTIYRLERGSKSTRHEGEVVYHRLNEIVRLL